MSGRYRREASVGLALLVLLCVLAALAPAFFHATNLRDLLVSGAPLLVAAVGMTLVILARQIDISIGAQFAICGVAAGLLAKTGLPMPLVGIATVVAGSLLGALNGLLVAGLGLPSIVVTLATMVILREGLRYWTEGVWVQDLPAGFQWFGLGQDKGRIAVAAVALLVFVAFAWGLGRLAAGRAVYATGSEPEAARLAGLRPRRVVFAAFVTMGALTGVSALLTSIQFIDVQTNAGVGLELKVIAAVVVGGTAISGGRGTLVGTFLGVALLGVLGPALSYLGTQAYWERALQGLVICGQQGRHLQHQAELQFPHDIQGGVALLWLEGIHRQKEPMPSEVRRVFFEAPGIGAPEQYQKDADQVQHFALGDRHMTFLGEHFMDLRHRPTFPEPPVANLDDDFQRKTAAAYGQTAGCLRGRDPRVPGAFRIRTTIAHADHQVTPVQKDHVFPPKWITPLQDASTTRARRFFWPIVALGNVAIIFGSSHWHTSLARGIWKSRFYPARDV